MFLIFEFIYSFERVKDSKLPIIYEHEKFRVNKSFGVQKLKRNCCKKGEVWGI